MSARAARLFAWLQDADFYRGMHGAAARLLPDGSRTQSWLDVGCGPGILTRIAAEKGYSARGIDRDPDMIGMAWRLAAARKSHSTFEVSDIEKAVETGERFDVVSASSLLVVLPDPAAALRQLASLTKPGGRVLVIEASSKMSRLRALSVIQSGRLGHRAYMLLAWAAFRSGRTLAAAAFDQPGIRASKYPILHDLADAWIVERIL